MRETVSDARTTVSDDDETQRHGGDETQRDDDRDAPDHCDAPDRGAIQEGARGRLAPAALCNSLQFADKAPINSAVFEARVAAHPDANIRLGPTLCIKGCGRERLCTLPGQPCSHPLVCATCLPRLERLCARDADFAAELHDEKCEACRCRS